MYISITIKSTMTRRDVSLTLTISETYYCKESLLSDRPTIAPSKGAARYGAFRGVPEAFPYSNPIISFPLVSISSSARNFLREKKRTRQPERGGQATEQGITAVTRETDDEERIKPGFYKRFWNCVRLGTTRSPRRG